MSRNVFTLFSDDVRHEIGGKISYIGTYTGKLLVPAFPTVLSKLCLTLRIATPTSKPFQKVVAKIYRNEEVIAEGSIPEQDLIAKQSDPTPSDNPEIRKFHAFQMGFVFSPFEIESPCFIRVRVETEGKELKGQGLRIDLAPEGTMFSVS